MVILASKFHKNSPATTSEINTNILVSAKKEIANLDLFKTENSFKISDQMRCSPNIQDTSSPTPTLLTAVVYKLGIQ